jgi:hypothetical protein
MGKRCGKPAIAKVTWQDNPPKYACKKHLRYAEVASKHMRVNFEKEDIDEAEGKTCDQED